MAVAPIVPVTLEPPAEREPAEASDDGASPAPEDEPLPPKTPAKRASRTIRRKKTESDDSQAREE
jgi:hypothetical protein